MLEYREDVASDDPLEIRTTVPVGGDEIQVTFDDQMKVVSVSD